MSKLIITGLKYNKLKVRYELNMNHPNYDKLVAKVRKKLKKILTNYKESIEDES